MEGHGHPSLPALSPVPESPSKTRFPWCPPRLPLLSSLWPLGLGLPLGPGGSFQSSPPFPSTNKAGAAFALCQCLGMDFVLRAAVLAASGAQNFSRNARLIPQSESPWLCGSRLPPSWFRGSPGSLPICAQSCEDQCQGEFNTLGNLLGLH